MFTSAAISGGNCSASQIFCSTDAGDSASSSAPDFTASRSCSRYTLVVTSITTSSASLLPMPNKTLSAPACSLSSAENVPCSHPCVRKLVNSVLASAVLSAKDVPNRFTAASPGSAPDLAASVLL